MDWKLAEDMLAEMWLTYTKDNIRKITYNREVFPLAFRFNTGERTSGLYESIAKIYRQLIYDPSLMS